MKIYMAQLRPKIGDINFNINEIKQTLKFVDSNIVVFPECFVTGYPADDLYLNSRFMKDVHYSWEQLRQISRDNTNQYLIIGTPRKDSNNTYNSAIVFYNGEIIKTVDKQYLPNYDVFDDKRWFVPGSNVDSTMVIDGKTIAIGICEDVWSQEWWDNNDADIYISINASPYSENKIQLREENINHKGWFFFVNMVGSQDELVFDGHSCAYKDGVKILQLKTFELDGDDVDVDNPLCVVNKGFVDHWMNVGEHSTQTVMNLAAIRMATRNYVNDTGFSKTVLGVSGGADSALVAWILGTLSFQTTGISMPTRFNSEKTKSLAQRVIEITGIEGKEVPIEDMFTTMVENTLDIFEKRRNVQNVKDAVRGKDVDVSMTPEENLQAHIRGDVLSYFSNINHALIISTGNKSEMAMGYATLYGDMRGGYNPLKDVLKTQVFAMLRLIADIEDNAGRNGDVFREIADLPPSAELRANQLDQDSLPPYDVLDREIVKFLNGELTELAPRIANAEYKRRQSTPGPRVTEKSFTNKDWRMPLMNGWRK